MLTHSYVLTGREKGEVTETALTDPGPGEVVLRVITNGVCTSDLQKWKNPPDSHQRLGHEPVGEIVEVGPGVSLKRGALVGGRVVNSYSRHVLASVEDLVAIPPGLRVEDVLPEPTGCVAEGLRRTTVPMGATVAVVGLGFMGLLTVQMLSAMGTSHVIGIDPRQSAQDLALVNGATVASAPSGLRSRSFSESGSSTGHGYDTVIEASGTQSGIDLATRLVRPHGCLSILGYHQGHRQIDVQSWNWKAIDVVNAHVRDRALLKKSTEAALLMQAAGRIDIASLITHRYEFDQIDEAFRALDSRPDGYVKGVVTLG